MILEDNIWAGSENSLQAVRDMEAGIKAKLLAGPMDIEDDEEEDYPRLLNVQDGIATVSVKGPLVNSDSPYLRFFGVTGYAEVRSAMMAAAEDPEVSRIVLDIDSGGGAVSGVDDTAKLIRLVNDKVKPVTSFTDGAAASAAYWLGCSAGEFYQGASALVGSIGVIAVHREYTEQMKMEGITPTVIRAGKFKALANPNEKLSEAGKAQIQAQADSAYKVFVTHVATMRGKSYEYADKTMSEGREFIGADAVDVGLTDGITTFDALLSDLMDKVVADRAKINNNSGSDRNFLSGSLNGGADMAKKALTEADIAALAAGASIAAVTATTETTEPVVQAAEITATLEGAEHGKEEGRGKEEVLKADAATTQEVVKVDASMQLLQSQLKEKDDALIDAKVQLAQTSKELEGAKATLEPLLKIATQSLNNMHVAMGHASVSYEGATAASVAEEHARVSEAFKRQFKVGGVAAVQGESESSKSGPYVMNNVTAAQVKAIRGF